MDRFREVFKNRHVVLPVIHVEGPKQAISNTAVAKRTGADGVFLINHKISCRKLLDIYRYILSKFPDFWVGLNILGLDAFSAFDRIFKKGLWVNGLWTDDARIFEREDDQYEAERIKQLFLIKRWKGLYFGGVAFKYKRHVDDLERAARIAARYMDVVTTSGSATGKPADVEKIRRMRKAIPGKPLAIASGITPDNVSDYLEADCFLVATGISRNFYTLDEAKTKRLIEIIRQGGC